MSEKFYTMDDIALGRGPKAKKPESQGYEPLPDLAKSVGIGALGTAQGVVGLSALAGADMRGDGLAARAYRGLGGLRDELIKSQSVPMKAARDEVMGTWDENEGFLENVGDTIAAGVRNPYYLAGLGAEAIGSIGPIGKAAGVLGRAAPALSTAARAGIAEGSVIAGLTAGEIAKEEGTTYKDRLLAVPTGVAGAALGFAGGRLAGRLDPEVIMADYFTGRATRKAVAKGTKAAAVNTSKGKGVVPGPVGRLGNAATGLAVEGAEEGLQEGMEEAAVGYGTDKLDWNTVGQAFTIGAMMGGVAGGGIGILTPSRGQSEKKPKKRGKPSEFETVTRALATLKATDEAGNVNTEQVDAVVDIISEQIGDAKLDHAGVHKFLQKAGATEEEVGPLFAQLTLLTTNKDTTVAEAARKVMAVAANVPVKQLPDFKTNKTLKYLKGQIAAQQAEFDKHDTTIKAVGNGSIEMRRKWEAQRKVAQQRLTALQAIEHVVEEYTTRRDKMREEELIRRRATGEIQEAQEVLMPGEDADTSTTATQPELVTDDADPVFEVGGPAPDQAATAPEDTTDPTIAGQQDFGSVPEGDLSNVSLSELKTNEFTRNAAAHRVLQNITSNLAAEFSSERLAQVGIEGAFEFLENLESEIDGWSLETLAKRAGVAPARVKALTKAYLRDNKGQAIDSLVDQLKAASRVSIARAVERYANDIALLDELQTANPGLTPGKLMPLYRQAHEDRGTTPLFKYAKDWPFKRTKKALAAERARTSKLGKPPDPKTEGSVGRADLTGPTQNILSPNMSVVEALRSFFGPKPKGRTSDQAQNASEYVTRVFKSTPADEGNPLNPVILLRHMRAELGHIAGAQELLDLVAQDGNIRFRVLPDFKGASGVARHRGSGSSRKAIIELSYAELERVLLARVVRQNTSWGGTELVSRILLHESVHALTSQALNSAMNKDVAGQLRQMASALQHELDHALSRGEITRNQYDDLRYAATNEHELVAELFSNTYLQEFLRNTPPVPELPGYKNNLIRSLLTQFLDAVRVALGIQNPEATNMLEQNFNVVGGLIVERRTGSTRDPGSSSLLIEDLPADKIFGHAPSTKPIRDRVGDLQETAQRAANSLGFTQTLLTRMAQRVPAARMLVSAIQKAQRIGTQWQQVHNQLDDVLRNLSYAQRMQVTRALVHYSMQAEATWPVPLQNAVRFKLDKSSADPSEWTWSTERFSDEDVTVDDAVYNSLDDAGKKALVETFETTAKVLAARTEMKLGGYKHFYEQLKHGTDSEAVAAEYEKALLSVIGLHNEMAKRAYVPQSRRGDFQVTVESDELHELRREAMGNPDKELAKRIRELEEDSNHYIRTTVEKEHKAAQIVEHYDSKGWVAGYKQDAEQHREGHLNADTLVKLLAKFSSGEGDPRLAAKLTEGIRAEMRQILVEQGSQNTELTSQMMKRNIAGVQKPQVLENTLTYIRHFGYAVAAAQTGADRVTAIQNMDRQIDRLEGPDNAQERGRYNELMSRLNEQFDVREGWVAEKARNLMAVNSFWFLLSNPSYYALQLTQSWVLSMPYLAGEFGASAPAALAKTYGIIAPHLKKAWKAKREVDFSAFPEGMNEMFQELLARNVLDVGVHHDMGDLGSDSAMARMQAHLYGYARRVELINRMSAAAAAYELKVKQLSKGRKLSSMSAGRRDAIQKEATDYAEHVTYKTHGDYSFVNAPKVFRTPVLRNIMQFKKIGVVVGELLVDTYRDAWKNPTLSTTARKLFAAKDNSIGIPPELMEKMTGPGWLSDAELKQVRDILITYSQEAAIRELDAKQLDVLAQIIDGELDPRNYVTREQALIARRSLNYLLATSGIVSGSLSIPFATSILAMIAYGLADEDDDADFMNDVFGDGEWNPKGTIMEVFGPDAGAYALRGVAGGLINIDVSRRVGINFVEQMLGNLYDPKSRDPSGVFNEIVTGMLGPSVSLGQDTMKAVNYLKEYQTSESHHDLVKAFSTAAPLGLRNYLNAGLLDEEGLVNDSRRELIPRDDFTDWEIIRKRIGFSPTKVSEFYDMQGDFDAVQQAVDGKRLLLKRSYLEAHRDGDKARMNRAVEGWKEMQTHQRKADMRPSPLSELHQYVIRKGREDREQVAGLRTTSRNRDVAERLARRYGFNLYRD